MSLLHHTFFPRSEYDMSDYGWYVPYPYAYKGMGFSGTPGYTGLTGNVGGLSYSGNVSSPSYTGGVLEPTYPFNKNTGATTLDLFDGFDEFDCMIGKNYYWIVKPDFVGSYNQTARVPQKYRILVDCSGYNPKNIKVECSGRKIFIIGKEEYRLGSEDYSTKDFKKSYDVPSTVEIEKFVSFMTPNGFLVIEFPVKESTTHPNSDLMVKLLDAGNGLKTMQIKLSLPDNFDQTKLWLFVKDRDFIIKSEDMSQKHHTHAKFYYYKRAILPENTDFDLLKCTFESNKLVVTAPLKSEYRGFRTVPIEFKKH